MSVKIRLARRGRKSVSYYHVVVADSHKKRDGEFIETVGSYNPQEKPAQFSFEMDRILYWIKQGAEPSDTVRTLLDADRFWQKVEAKEKGLPAEAIAAIGREPEKKRAPKKRKEKKE